MAKLARSTPTVSPFISREDIEKFSVFAKIQDEDGFTAALRNFIFDRTPIEKKTEPKDRSHTVQARLKQKVMELTAKQAWEPSETDLQRGRVQLLKEFNVPNNLPLARFAKLANKSRQQIYKDVAAKRLLSLNVGARGQRIPDWQLNADALSLTQRILEKAKEIDEWTLFHAMSSPMDALHGKSAVEFANKSNLDKVVSTVLNDLGIHD